jgi:Mn2+/Fe2+ NRAMP family transporter
MDRSGPSPGYVAGASAADPTTVASISIAGAATGYGLAWVVALLFPMLAIVQSMAASVGTASRTSIQGAIRQQYGIVWASIALISIAGVNIVTLTADLDAGSEALHMLAGVPRVAFVIPLAAGVGWLLVSRSYRRVESVLCYLPLGFAAYGVSAILARADWTAFFRSIVIPHFEWSLPFVGGALALLGTTLTSYEYLWESIEVSERHATSADMHYVRTNAVRGALPACVTFLLILAATAATLGKHGVSVQTAADAAMALEPLAGTWASRLFAVGLLASAVLAVPILAGSTAYAVSHTFGWRAHLDDSPNEARPFYAVLLGTLALSTALGFANLSPIALLFWASIAGAFGTPVTLVFLVVLACSRSLMGSNRIGLPLAAAGWTVAGVVIAASLAFLLASGQHAR